MNKKEVEKIYNDIFLEISEEELDNISKKFNDVLKSVEVIREKDTSGLETFEITSDNRAILREDIARESIDREDAFKNTKHREYGYFKLERILD